MTLWRISGETANDSTGGSTCIMALTKSPDVPPDPEEMLAEADPKSKWYRIDSIEQIVTFEKAWDTSKIPTGVFDGD